MLTKKHAIEYSANMENEPRPLSFTASVQFTVLVAAVIQLSLIKDKMKLKMSFNEKQIRIRN